MVTTIFGDDIINSTELKKKWKHWLDKAYRTPISITSGSRNWVLINRENIGHLLMTNYWAEKIIRFNEELSEGRANNSSVFPWAKELDDEEKLEFYNELLSTFKDVLNNRNRLALDEMLDAWVATAEAKTNPEIMELLNKKGRPREYVELKN